MAKGKFANEFKQEAVRQVVKANEGQRGLPLKLETSAGKNQGIKGTPTQTSQTCSLPNPYYANYLLPTAISGVMDDPPSFTIGIVGSNALLPLHLPQGQACISVRREPLHWQELRSSQTLSGGGICRGH